MYHIDGLVKQPDLDIGTRFTVAWQDFRPRAKADEQTGWLAMLKLEGT